VFRARFATRVRVDAPGSFERNDPIMSTLRILSAGSTLHGVKACVALASGLPGMPPEIATDHGNTIRDAALRGEADADVVLLPVAAIDALIANGLAREKMMLGRVGIGGVVREGSPCPDIASMMRLRAAITSADAILLTRAPSGHHLMAVIAQLGLGDAVAPKLLRFETSAKLNLHLAGRSDRALGFGPETEIRAGHGVAWIGDIPAQIQVALPYAAAMLTRTTQPEAARAFLALLATGPARAAFVKSGVRPAGIA
jgi:molybdate transport system substrate-binding protein